MRSFPQTRASTRLEGVTRLGAQSGDAAPQLHKSRLSEPRVAWGPSKAQEVIFWVKRLLLEAPHGLQAWEKLCEAASIGLGRDPAIWLKSLNDAQPFGSTFVPGPLPRTALLHTLLGCGAELCVGGGRWQKRLKPKSYLEVERRSCSRAGGCGLR